MASFLLSHTRRFMSCKKGVICMDEVPGLGIVHMYPVHMGSEGSLSSLRAAAMQRIPLLPQASSSALR